MVNVPKQRMGYRRQSFSKAVSDSLMVGIYTSHSPGKTSFMFERSSKHLSKEISLLCISHCQRPGIAT